MSPTLFTVWQFQVQKKFSLETKLQPKAVKIYTFSLSNLMTQLFKVKTPANLVTSSSEPVLQRLLDLSPLQLFGPCEAQLGDMRPTFHPCLCFAYSCGSRMSIARQWNGLDHLCNKCKQEKQTTWRGVWTKIYTTVTLIFELNIGFWRITAYLFIGYHFCIGYTWIIICKLSN